MHNNGVYLEIIEGEKLVFTDNFSEGWKPNENPFMTAIIIFEDLANGSTKYTAMHDIGEQKIVNNMKIWGFILVGEKLLINLKSMQKVYNQLI